MVEQTATVSHPSERTAIALERIADALELLEESAQELIQVVDLIRLGGIPQAAQEVKVSRAD